MCPIRSKQRQQSRRNSRAKKAVSKIKDVCHFHQKYKAEEEFIGLKPTEIVFSLQTFYIFYLHVV